MKLLRQYLPPPTIKFLDGLDIVVFDYLLSEHGGVCVVTNTTWYICINTFGKAETQLHKIPEQAAWLKRVTPSLGSFFGRYTLWLVCVFGTVALKSTPNTGNYPADNNYRNLPGALYWPDSFKLMFPSENDLPETGTSKREQRTTDLIIVNLKS